MYNIAKQKNNKKNNPKTTKKQNNNKKKHFHNLRINVVPNLKGMDYFQDINTFIGLIVYNFTLKHPASVVSESPRVMWSLIEKHIEYKD